MLSSKNIVTLVFPSIILICIWVNRTVFDSNNILNLRKPAAETVDINSKEFLDHVNTQVENTSRLKSDIIDEALQSYDMSQQKTLFFSSNGRLYDSYLKATLNENNLTKTTQLFEQFPIWSQKVNVYGNLVPIGVHIGVTYSPKELLHLQKAGYDGSQFPRDKAQGRAMLGSKEEIQILSSVFGMEIHPVERSEDGSFANIELSTEDQEEWDGLMKLEELSKSSSSPSQIKIIKRFPLCTESFENNDTKPKDFCQFVYDICTKNLPSALTQKDTFPTPGVSTYNSFRHCGFETRLYLRAGKIVNGDNSEKDKTSRSAVTIIPKFLGKQDGAEEMFGDGDSKVTVSFKNILLLAKRTCSKVKINKSPGAPKEVGDSLNACDQYFPNINSEVESQAIQDSEKVQK